MSITASEFLKWLRVFDVTTGGGPAPTGALLAINNLDDVLNSTSSIENLGLGRPGILILTDADFAAGGGTYTLTNPPPIYISMSATSPGRVLQLPPQNEAKSLQGSEDIRLITGPTSEPININNGAGTLVHQVAPDSAWQAIPNDRTTIAGAWEFLGIVMTINGNHTGNVVLASDPQTIYVSPNGSNVNGNGSVLFPYATLSHAMNVATPSPATPYEIVMQTGVYTETDLTLKANVFISGNQSALTVTGTIDLDVGWGSGGFLYWLGFRALSLPATINLDFTSVFSPFSLFVFSDNIITSPVPTDLVVKGAIFISRNNFGFSSQINYEIDQCYGALLGGACGNVEVIDTGNYSITGMTEIGNCTATFTQSGDMNFLHQASIVYGDTLYRSTGDGNLYVLEKGVSHNGDLTLDNGLGGGSANLSSNTLTFLPTLLNGATYQPDSIGDAVRANAYFTPSNYTPLPGAPGQWVADSVTGNLAGIDAALADSGSIPPAYAEAYFQGNTQDTVFTFPNTPVKVRATAYNAGDLDGFTLVDGTLTYTGLALRTVQITAMLTATYQGTVQNTSFYITKNGVPLAKSKQTSAIGFVTPSPEPLPVQATSQVITGDEFELWVSNDDNTNAITVVDLNYSINGMSGSSANAGVPPAYAEMFFQDNVTPTPIANVNLPTKVVATYTGDMLKDFTHSNGTLTYQGAISKVFVIDADLTATYSGTAQNTSFYIAVNGAVVAKSKQKTFIGPVTPADMPNPCHAVMTLHFGDTVEVWVENNDNANDPTIVDFNLFVHSIDLIGTSPNVSNLEQLIWVNDLSGADTNQGTIDSPMKTYEAARLLAKARGASLLRPFDVVLVGRITSTIDLVISPFINIIGYGSYTGAFIGSGHNVVLDPEWGTVSTPFAMINNVEILASAISLVYSAYQAGSFLRFQDCALQSNTASIIGSGTNASPETVTFINCNVDILGSGPAITSDNINLNLFNTSVQKALSVSVTSAVTNANCIVSAAQAPTHDMTFSATSTGNLSAKVNACNMNGRTLTIGGIATVGVDVASYGFTLAFSGGATLAQLTLLSQGDGLEANTNFTPANYTPVGTSSYKASSLTGNLAGIDAALATAGGGVVPSEMIFVDGINGNDANSGAISSPLQTYEAARLLAVSRNPQYGAGQTIVIMTTVNAAGNMTISPFVSVVGFGKYCQIMGISGDFVLDPAWGSTPFGEANISNIALIGQSINFTFNTFTDYAFVRFENCSLQLLNAGPTATIIGSDGSGNTNCETVIFLNCTLDLGVGLPEPQFISDNVNLFLLNSSVSNLIDASVTSATVAATLLVQNAIANVGDITLNATSTGTLSTQIAGCNTEGATLTVNGTSNTVNIDADSYKFGSFVFSGGAGFSNIKATSPIILYVNSISGNDNNSGSINYPMQTYEAARLKAIALGASSSQPFVIQISGAQNIAGDMTLSANVCIQGNSPYSDGFIVSGDVVIDPNWGSGDLAYTQVRNMYMYLAGGDYTFTFTNSQVFSFLKFMNVAMNTGGFISITGSGDVGGNRETIVFENCTNDLLDYADGFIAENVDLFLINTDITAGSVTMTASTAAAITYNLVINNARFYTNDISVVTNNTSSLNTRITASNTQGRTLTIDGTNNTVYVDAASYMFTLALANGATLADLNIPSLSDGMTANLTPTNYTPTGSASDKADSMTGHLRGIDDALPQSVLNGITFASSVGVSAINITRSHEVKIGGIVVGSVIFTFTATAALVTIGVNKSFGSTFVVGADQCIGSGICAKTPTTAIGDASVQIVQAQFLTDNLQFVIDVNGNTDYIAEITFTYEVT